MATRASVTPREPVVSPETPMPKGYGFLRKGNPFLTALCRRKTHEAKKTLYVVMNKAKAEGLRAPRWILAAVREEERATRSRRRAAVDRKDASTTHAFEASILSLFPKIPRQDLDAILRRSLKKRSGRVGRTGTLELREKARLAVQAHVRHCHTDYDAIIQKTTDREKSRKKVYHDTRKVLSEWGGKGGTETLPVIKPKLMSTSRSRTSRPTRAGASRNTAKKDENLHGGTRIPLRLKEGPPPTSNVIDLTLDSEDEEGGGQSDEGDDVLSTEEFPSSGEETDEDEDEYEDDDDDECDGLLGYSGSEDDGFSDS